MSIPLLIICGPTATGKTSLAIQLAKKFNGELISADSRQVYKDLDIITGKDHGTFPIHLTDLVSPNEPFSVSQWHKLAVTTITDIHSRNKLPIVVGGTGLYIKSLLQQLSHISIPPNPQLRSHLQSLSADQLFNYLNQLSSTKAQSLNSSDRFNPRRLIRAIEIVSSPISPSTNVFPPPFSFLLLGLTAPLSVLDKLITSRVDKRLSQGAAKEAQQVLSNYSHDLPSLSACGYLSFLTPDPRSAWITSERQYARRQITWFKKQPSIHWFDISQPDWQSQVLALVKPWYNQNT